MQYGNNKKNAQNTESIHKDLRSYCLHRLVYLKNKR